MVDGSEWYRMVPGYSNEHQWSPQIKFENSVNIMKNMLDAVNPSSRDTFQNKSLVSLASKRFSRSLIKAIKQWGKFVPSQ